MRSTKRNHRQPGITGFTLVELLLTLFIASVLSSLVVAICQELRKNYLWHSAQAQVDYRSRLVLYFLRQAIEESNIAPCRRLSDLKLNNSIPTLLSKLTPALPKHNDQMILTTMTAYAGRHALLKSITKPDKLIVAGQISPSLQPWLLSDCVSGEVVWLADIRVEQSKGRTIVRLQDKLSHGYAPLTYLSGVQIITYFVRSQAGVLGSLFRKVNIEPAVELISGIADFQVRAVKNTGVLEFAVLVASDPILPFLQQKQVEIGQHHYQAYDRRLYRLLQFVIALRGAGEAIEIAKR